jgi:hypothetical protein
MLHRPKLYQTERVTETERRDTVGKHRKGLFFILLQKEKGTRINGGHIWPGWCMSALGN